MTWVKRTYGTIGPSASLDVFSTIIILSIGMDGRKRSLGSALCTGRDRWSRSSGWRDDSTAFEWRGHGWCGRLRRGYFMVEVKDVAWEFDLL